jgi:hypothetical protein
MNLITIKEFWSEDEAWAWLYEEESKTPPEYDVDVSVDYMPNGSYRAAITLSDPQMEFDLD